MTKEELVHITIKQLTENLKTNPENFRLENPSPSLIGSSFPGPTIVWQFKFQLEDNKFILDPLNSTKTIIVTYSTTAKQLSCHIYNREVNTLNHAMMADTQVVVQYPAFVPLFFFQTYREFTNLKKSLIKRKNDKEFMDYMKKLRQIFPTTHDDDLLK